MARTIKHRFGTTTYTVDLEPFEGITDHKDGSDPYIRLPDGLPYGNSQKAKRGLVTLLHECIHASKWYMPEQEVDNISTDIASLLWKLGYRRVRPHVRSANGKK